MKKHHIYLSILLTSSCFLGMFALTLKRNDNRVVATDEDKKPVAHYDVVREVFPGNESALVYEPTHHQQTSTDGQHSQEVHAKNRQQQRKVKQISYSFVAREKSASGANQNQKDFLQKPVVRDVKSIHSLTNGENVIAKSEALQQQVQSDTDYMLPKMVVTIGTTIAALFGMCLMAAIFQCCCRKKRSQADADDIKSEKNSETQQRSKSPSPEKEKPTDNDDHDDKSEVDKLLVDDELGDFSMVQRETEILKSYRKPPPPKNRARATRSPKAKAGNLQENSLFTTVITEEPSGSMSSRSGSLRTSPEKKPEDEESETREQTESTETENRVSFNAAQSLLESVMSEVKGQIADSKEDTTVNGETTPPVERKKSPSPEKETDNEKGGASTVLCDTHINGGNIFLQIDPTVKRKELSEKHSKSKIPVKASASVPTEGAKKRPPSDHKEERKFIVPSVHGDQMDDLVKSLKSKIKEDTSQSARNLSFNKVAPTTEEEIQPMGRERCYSDPAKQNAQSLKQTHL